MNNVKLLHIKCCFFQFFNDPVALKNKKNFGPQEKVEMTLLSSSLLLAIKNQTSVRYPTRKPQISFYTVARIHSACQSYHFSSGVVNVCSKSPQSTWIEWS